MIEFDVLPERSDVTVKLVHAQRLRGRPGAQAVHARQGPRPPRPGRVRRIELDVDLKLPGYELECVARARQRLLALALISPLYEPSRAPAATGASRDAPRLVRPPSSGATPHATLSPRSRYLVLAALPARFRAARRRRQPREPRRDWTRSWRTWRLVTPRLVRALHAAGWRDLRLDRRRRRQIAASRRSRRSTRHHRRPAALRRRARVGGHCWSRSSRPNLRTAASARASHHCQALGAPAARRCWARRRPRPTTRSPASSRRSGSTGWEILGVLARPRRLAARPGRRDSTPPAAETRATGGTRWTWSSARPASPRRPARARGDHRRAAVSDGGPRAQ